MPDRKCLQEGRADKGHRVFGGDKVSPREAALARLYESQARSEGGLGFPGRHLGVRRVL